MKTSEEILDAINWFPSKGINPTQRLILLKAMDSQQSQFYSMIMDILIEVRSMRHEQNAKPEAYNIIKQRQSEAKVDFLLRKITILTEKFKKVVETPAENKTPKPNYHRFQVSFSAIPLNNILY